MLKKIINHNMAKNFVALGLVQVANYIVPLLAWPLLAKGLGLEQFGVLIVLFSICTLASILTDFGFNLSATHHIVQYKNDKVYISHYLANIFIIKFILALIASIIAVIYIYTNLMNNKSNLFLDEISIVCVVLIIFTQALNSIWFFQGIEKMKYITIANIVSKVGYVAILYLIFLVYKSLNAVLFCFFLSQLIIIILYFYFIYRENYKISSPIGSQLWKDIKYSFSFFISRIAVSVYTTANTLILGHFQGNISAGLYGAAEKIYSAGNGVSGIVSQVMFPYLTRIGNLQFLFKFIIILILPVFLGSYIIGLFADEIMVLVFGENFRQAGKLLKLFLILLNITFFSIIIGYPGFSAIRKVHLANYTVMFGAVFHLVGLSMLYFLNLIIAENVLLMIIATESLILCLRCVGLYLYRNHTKSEAL